MPAVDAILRATILASIVAYAAAEYLWFLHRVRAFALRRALWTTAFVLCAVHVARAFDVVHHWSHAAAEQHTADVTARVTGVDSGLGLYVNYAFVALWAADVAWSWLAPSRYLRRGAVAGAAVSATFLFMVFNGAVVFASGPARVAGILATATVLWAWWRGRDRIVAA
jgi:hypothetical protein